MRTARHSIVVAVVLVAQVWGSSMFKRTTNPLAAGFRQKRSQHIIEDCMTVTSEPGTFFYRSRGDDSTVCGVYLTTDADKIVQVTFDYLDVPCTSGGLVAFVDGWELGGGLFPRAEDGGRRLEERVVESCGSSPLRKTLVSSQNAALIQFRVPKRGRGFSFRVAYLPNPSPCNVLVSDEEGVYTLRNYGRASNCSLTAAFPIRVAVLSLSVGPMAPFPQTLLKCKEQGSVDYVEIGGGADLGLSRLDVSENFCGVDSIPGRIIDTVVCGVSTVKLVSSGTHDNSVVVSVRMASPDDLASAALLCPFP